VKDAAQARRRLAIAAVLDGNSRAESAKIGGMDRQTLRDWMIRFNEQGGMVRQRVLWQSRAARVRALYLAVEDIDHARTKNKSPQTNGIYEPFHKAVQLGGRDGSPQSAARQIE